MTGVGASFQEIRKRFDPNPPVKRSGAPHQALTNRSVNVIEKKPLVAFSEDKFETIGRRKLNTYQNALQIRRS